MTAKPLPDGANKASRIAFEVWVNNPHMLNRIDEPAYADEYEHPFTAGAWAAWQERARLDAEIASATVCDTHLPTGVRIYGNKAANAIKRAAGIE
jgi:hypothetical protein